jgi:hypothetical protein
MVAQALLQAFAEKEKPWTHGNRSGDGFRLAGLAVGIWPILASVELQDVNPLTTGATLGRDSQASIPAASPSPVSCAVSP